MQCIRPPKVGYASDGTLVFSNKGWDSSIVGFQVECRKCLACLLNQARDKAIRCIHEARMHDNSIFLTLTYADEYLKSPTLNYLDFQLFMKSLLEHVNRDITCKENRIKIPLMVTGEYGAINKRPHWHAILFNYSPADSQYRRTTDLGETVYTSETIDRLWNRGSHEYGSVTLNSAGYVARYGAKALIHAHEKHLYKPIHNTSKRHAIGKAWISENYKHTFDMGYVLLPDENNGYAPGKIPRYYVDWAKKYQPETWLRYVTQKRPEIIALAEQKSRREELEYLSNYLALDPGTTFRVPLTKSKVKETILKSKFKQLQEKLKL